MSSAAMGASPIRPVAEIHEELPMVHTGKPRLAAIVSTLVIVSAGSAIALFPVPSTWQPDSVLLALCLIALSSYITGIQNRQRTFYVLSEAPTMVALVLLGPVPAVVVYGASDLIDFIVSRYRPAVFLCNIACVLVSILVTATVFYASGADITPHSTVKDYVALILSGLLLSIIFSTSAALLARLTDGLPVRELVSDNMLGMWRGELPAFVGACLACVLYFRIGVAGLFALLPLLMVLQVSLLRAFLRRCPNRMPLDLQTAALARVLANSLSLSDEQKRALRAAAVHRVQDSCIDPHDLRSGLNAVLYSTERWDGKNGFPGIVSGDLIPVESRVLAVASRWSEMAAKGTPTPRILADLRSRAGSEFDPQVVAAARNAFEIGAVADDPQPWVQFGLPSGAG